MVELARARFSLDKSTPAKNWRAPSRSRSTSTTSRHAGQHAEARELADKAEEILRADLENESDTIRASRERPQQCEALGEYAIAEDIREILRQEQEPLVDLATALGEDAPDLSKT